jgi:uncharacterized protein
MPIIHSTYKKPWYLPNAHIETIYPSMYRKVEVCQTPIRERIHTKDGDFLDIDWYQKNSDQLVIVSHGLEGSSRRPYVLGMVKIFNENGFDALAWNCRGCSGEVNAKPRFYHHGAIEDLEDVVHHALASGRYKQIHLVGLSLGGALGVNYLSQRDPSVIPKEIKSNVAVSVPFSIKSSASALEQGFNRFYRNRFLKKITSKAMKKSAIYPEKFPLEVLANVKDFRTFDEFFTAPLHGFKDADDFYYHASAIHFIDRLQHPTLLISAWNDPMLPDDCYPISQVEKKSQIFLEIPESGGHVGFLQSRHEYTYVEDRALEFVLSKAH